MTRVRSGTRLSRAKLQPRHPKILFTATPERGRLQNGTDCQRLQKLLPRQHIGFSLQGSKNAFALGTQKQPISCGAACLFYDGGSRQTRN
jgi:hypothetical protein